MDGYFVHFVAPENLPPMSKHVAFVLDTSGSMAGKKMEQTQRAMETILSDLREEDSFTIIDFDDKVTVWADGDLEQNEARPATKANVEKAIEYVDRLVADGGTNINDALVQALSVVSNIQRNEKKEGKQCMIIFLTDGHVSWIG